jgi:hypothetical protein
MRPWIIVLSSSIGAIAAAVLLAGLAVMNAAPSKIVTSLWHMLQLAVAALAVYALCAMLMVTATLLTRTLRVRHEMEANSPEAARPARLGCRP